MASQANIVAFDGAATPVSHTFEPIGTFIDSKTHEAVAQWREVNTSLPLVALATVEQRSKKLPSGVHMVTNIVAIPVMESISGQNAAGYTAAPKVAFVDTIKTIGFFSERSTVANRRLARQLSNNIMGNIATSVAPATSGFASDLFDKSVAAS